MQWAGRSLRFLSYLIFFLVLCFLWPRELDGFLVGRDGRSSVPENAMVNVHYVSVEQGRVQMEAWAKDAVYDMATSLMEAKTVNGFFYNLANEKTEVKADRAWFHFNYREIHLNDNVWSRSPDGFVLTGPEAKYSLPKRVLTAPQPVEGVLEDKSVQIWGDQATSSLDDNTVDLFGNARAQFRDKRRGLTKVRGDSAHMERNKEQLTFRDNVKVEQQKTVATSHVAHLFYDNRARNVRYMSLLEDVRIEEGARHTRSQVAEFFAPTDTIVLSEFPSVYHGDDVVTGDRITLYRATGVVEVTATNAAGSPEQKKPPTKGKPEKLSPEDEELIP